MMQKPTYRIRGCPRPGCGGTLETLGAEIHCLACSRDFVLTAAGLAVAGSAQARAESDVSQNKNRSPVFAGRPL